MKQEKGRLELKQSGTSVSLVIKKAAAADSDLYQLSVAGQQLAETQLSVASTSSLPEPISRLAILRPNDFAPVL